MVFLDLNDEQTRLSTFNSDWPHAYIDPKELANTGFYYIGPHDQVKCYICAVQVSSWEMGDNVITEHVRWSPRCTLARLFEELANERRLVRLFKAMAIDVAEPASKRARLNADDDL